MRHDSIRNAEVNNILFCKFHKLIDEQQPMSEDEFIRELKKIVKNMSAASLIGWACLETKNIKSLLQNAVMRVKESLESRKLEGI